MQQILLAVLFFFCLATSLSYVVVWANITLNKEGETGVIHPTLIIILWTLFYYFSNK